MIGFAVGLMVLALLLSLIAFVDTSAPTDPAAAAALAERWSVYHRSVLEYAADNPGFTGAVGDGALDLPPGFFLDGTRGARIDTAGGRRQVIVYADLPAGHVVDVVDLIGERAMPGAGRGDHPVVAPLNVGVRRGGGWYSPVHGDLAGTPPAFVPDGAVMSMQEVR